MPRNHDRILLVECYPEICGQIFRQAFQIPFYQVLVVSDASKAIQQVVKFTPVLFTPKNYMQGFSGKDLLVALISQRLQIPGIVNAKISHVNDVIQANRLDANDYLLWPAREDEVLSVVERGLRLVWEFCSHWKSGFKFNKVKRETERRVREAYLRVQKLNDPVCEAESLSGKGQREYVSI